MGVAIVSDRQLALFRSQILADRANLGRSRNAAEAKAAIRRANDDKAAQWASGVLADRAAKAVLRQRKLAEDEALRIQARLHEAEAAAAAAERAAVVAAAQRKLFLQQHAARVLRSAAALAEAGAEAEAAAAEAAQAAALAQRRVQLGQLEVVTARIRAERAATRAAGEALRLQAATAAQALRREQAAARERAIVANLATAAANDELQLLKLKEQQREAEADAAIAAYAARKEALAAERQRQREADAAAKEAHRQRNVAALESAFLKAQHDNDSRVEREVQQAEDHAAADEAARVAHETAAWQANASQWSEQLQARRQAAVATRQQEAAEAALAASAATAGAAAEAAEAAKRRAQNQRAVAYLGRQVSQKQRRAVAAKLQDCEEAAARRQGQAAATMALEAYAAEVMQGAAAAGKVTKPMQLYLQQVLKPEGLTPADDF